MTHGYQACMEWVMTEAHKYRKIISPIEAYLSLSWPPLHSFTVLPKYDTKLDRASTDSNTQTSKKVVRWAFHFNVQLHPLDQGSNTWSLFHITADRFLRACLAKMGPFR